MELLFSESAMRQLKKIGVVHRRRIVQKLRFFISQKNPYRFADTIRDPRIGQLRFRVGDYRVICDASRNVVTILRVGHRKDIYR